MSKYRRGNIIKATVNGIENYGIFVSCDDYYSGLIHISEISDKYVKDINEYVKVGDVISVKILDVDEEAGQLKLSIKNINYKSVHNFKRKKIKETSSLYIKRKGSTVCTAFFAYKILRYKKCSP